MRPSLSRPLLLAGLAAACGGKPPAAPEPNPEPDPCLIVFGEEKSHDTIRVALPGGDRERFVAAHLADQLPAVDCLGTARVVPLPAFRAVTGSSTLLVPADSAIHGPVLVVEGAGDGDPRDLLDRGIDVVVTADPTALDYARRRGDLRLVPLAWAARYILAFPPGARPIELTPGLKAGLARDAIRAETRPAADTVLSEAGCPGSGSGPVSRAAAIGVAGGDPIARDIADRLVALNPPGLSQVLVYGAAAFDSALALGSAAAFVVRMEPDEPPCDRLAPAWTIVPVVEARNTAIVRPGTPAFLLLGDGGIRFLAGAVR
ncbi:MAG: hypothetical protein ACRENB_03145 [Gemmatimonadales bacterium]